MESEDKVLNQIYIEIKEINQYLKNKIEIKREREKFKNSKSVNNYDDIIISDLESRITILEEENEKYRR